mgnify:CR=1 FL=1
MALMDRIYIEDFLQKSYPEQFSFVEKVRTLRSSALNEAMISSKKVTKSAKKNIAKGKSTRKPKDPTKAAKAALSKLSPEQIALIKKQFQ